MRDRILQLVQVKGPLLPVDIRGELKIDSMFVGAYLSELIKDGKIKSSHAKIGSSPLYYVSGQERYLEQLREYLHPKIKETFDLLKEKKVLRDSNLSEVMKAAIREIKDFATPLTVNKKELFWKYYLVPQEEAVNIIKVILTPDVKPQVIQGTKSETRAQMIEKITRPVPEPIPVPKKTHPMHKQSTQRTEHPLHAHGSVSNIGTSPTTQNDRKPRIEDSEIKKGVDTIRRRAQEIRDLEKETIIVQKIVPEEVHKKRIYRKKSALAEEQTRLVNKTGKENKGEGGEESTGEPEEAVITKESPVHDPLLDQIRIYFSEKNIIIKSYELVRKEKEIELVVSVPSVIGRISYFCVVRN